MSDSVSEELLPTFPCFTCLAETNSVERRRSGGGGSHSSVSEAPVQMLPPQLHLYDIKSSARTTLLSYCSFAQWVPGSDVVVAQSDRNLCIWYSVDSPESVTTFPVKVRRDGGVCV